MTLSRSLLISRRGALATHALAGGLPVELSAVAPTAMLSTSVMTDAGAYDYTAQVDWNPSEISHPLAWELAPNQPVNEERYDRRVIVSETTPNTPADGDLWVRFKYISGDYGYEILTDEAVGYWPMQEEAGATISRDEFGGRDISWVNTPTLGVAGPWGTQTGVGLARADSDYGIIPSTLSTGVDYTAGISVEVWAWIDTYATSTTYGAPFLSEAYEGDSRIKAVLGIGSPTSTTGSTYFAMHDGAWRSGCVDPNSAGLGSWVHWVGTYDNSTFRLFKDTVEVMSWAYAGNVTHGTERWFVGRRWNANEFHDGRLSHLAVYNKALSPSRVTAHYDAAV